MTAKDTDKLQSRREVLRVASTLGIGLMSAATVAKASPSISTDTARADSRGGPFVPESNTADILVETLIRWDVQYVFGIVGDGINSIIEALHKRQDAIRFIAVRHEEAAAFMASGYAKHTGKLGVCVATTGPGAVHLMNGPSLPSELRA